MDDNYKVEAQISGIWVTIADNMVEPEAHIILNKVENSSINATDMRVVESPL
tara:strand:+ start:3642 stop:3797 length:156 start_codon:yes stop_codon:yes gene_type:complete